MRWMIYGIDNSHYYDVRCCEVAFTASEKKEIIKAFKKEFPLIEVERESKNGNIRKESYTGKKVSL